MRFALRGRVWACLLGCAVWSGVAAQDMPCRQALALGLDVSGSVDALEYRQQLDGLASAFQSAPVRQAIFANPAALVEVMIYEWSGPGDHHVLVDWVGLATQADLEILTETLRQTRRRAASSGTALGEAMQVGFAALSQRSRCWSRTLDISGDGKSNLGRAPESVRSAFLEAGMTVNALVIGADAPGIGDLRQAEISELSSYFRTRVIAGPDAFVQTAIGYAGYVDAMARKLERELRDSVFSRLRDRLSPTRPKWTTFSGTTDATLASSRQRARGQ